MTVPCGRSSRSARGSAALRPRHWKTTSAPRSPAPCRQRVLSATAGVARRPGRGSGRAPRRPPGAVGVGSSTTTAAAPWCRANSAVSRPTTPPPTTATRRPRTPSPSDAHVAAVHVGGGVQQPVRADRAHVRDVDAEQRVEVAAAAARSGRAPGRRGSRCGARRSSRPRCRRRSPGRPALHHPADLHVAEPRPPGSRAGPVRAEQAEVGVPGDEVRYGFVPLT